MNLGRKDIAFRMRQAPRRHLRATTGDPGPETPFLSRYVEDGRVVAAPGDASIAEGLRFAEASDDHLTMIIDPAPTPRRVRELADAMGLHQVLVDDLLHAGQRPKLERYGDVLFLVARAARYIDELEEVELAEFHVLLRDGVIVVLCQDGTWIDGTPAEHLVAQAAEARDDRTLLAGPDLLRRGPEAVLYRFLDALVDGYGPVLRGLEIDKEQIERQVFSGDQAVAERIYRLSQEVIDMQHATASLIEVLLGLRRGFGKYGVSDQMQTYLQDVSDHLERAHSHAIELRESLSQILSVNATLVAQRQNEDMKKISGWAAILFAPTLIGAIYGMNFDDMPELHWAYGYPAAVGAMVVLGALLYVLFKWRRWM